MAALGTSLVTLVDVAKGKNKQIGKVAEVLLQMNPMLNDIPYMVMNEGTIHKEEIRSALPSVYYRKANQPIPSSKTTTEERSFTAAHIESKSQVDEGVAKRGGLDRVGYNRWNQAQGHMQAHALEHASLTIYGSPTTATRKVAGFFDIYSTTLDTEPTSLQIIDAGGVNSDNCSILLSLWGEQSIFGIYEAGTTAGLRRIDRSVGDNMVQIYGTDEQGNPGTFWGYEEDFMLDHGLVVKDYRQGARIANIDTAALLSGVNSADLLGLMIDAAYKIFNPANGVGCWYVNRTIEAWLHKQALEKVAAGAGLRFENVDGKSILHFMGYPVRRADALLNTESQVTNSTYLTY